MMMPFRMCGSAASTRSRCEMMSWCGEKLSQGSVSHSTKCSTGRSAPAKKRISASSWSAWRGSSASISTGLSTERASSAAANAALAPIRRPHPVVEPGAGTVGGSEISSEMLNEFLVSPGSLPGPRVITRVTNGARLLHRAHRIGQDTPIRKGPGRFRPGPVNKELALV